MHTQTHTHTANNLDNTIKKRMDKTEPLCCGRRDEAPALSSKCMQCHVNSRRTTLNTDLFGKLQHHFYEYALIIITARRYASAVAICCCRVSMSLSVTSWVHLKIGHYPLELCSKLGRGQSIMFGGLEPRAWRARDRGSAGSRGRAPGQAGKAPLKLKTF